MEVLANSCRVPVHQASAISRLGFRIGCKVKPAYLETHHLHSTDQARAAVVCWARKSLLFDSDDYEADVKEATSSDHQALRSRDQQQQQFAADQVGSHDSSRGSREPRHNQDPTANDGIVGLFVAGWMAIIGCLVHLSRPLVSFALLLAQPLTHMSPARARARLDKLLAELPDGFWAKVWALWELPVVRSIRITASVANWGVRLPAIAAILLTQGSMLASQVSLPMLAPLLLGTGMMINSIKSNASFIIPRLGLMVVLLWVLWFVNSVIQTTWLELRTQGRIDGRTLSGARMITECSSLLLAGIVVLSMLGLNVNALLLPAGVVLAIASRDLLQNLIAGFYLVLVQPFRLGDRVAVSCSIPVEKPVSSVAQAAGVSNGGSTGRSNAGATGLQGWFEGVCEKVDLRYTVLRDGRRRLMVPNGAFVSREFLVYDDMPADSPSSPSSSPSSSGEPVIREGHISTELPAAARPLFQGVAPGMIITPQGAYTPAHTGAYTGAYHQPYQQHFTALHYQPQPYHQPQQLDDSQQQDLLEQESVAPAAAAAASPGEGGDSDASGSQQLQQQGSDDNTHHSNSSRRHAAAAKGPPGYLPQGFAGPYVSIPVYYNIGIPGLPWSAPGSGPGPGPEPLQQQPEDVGGMHQPVPVFEPAQRQPTGHDGVMHQQASTQQPQQQQQQPPAQRRKAAARQGRDSSKTPPGGSNGGGSPQARAGGVSSSSTNSSSSSSSSSAAAQQQRAAAVMANHVTRSSGLWGGQLHLPQHGALGVALPAVAGYGYWVADTPTFESQHHLSMASHHVLHYQHQAYQQPPQVQLHYQHQPHYQQPKPSHLQQPTAAAAAAAASGETFAQDDAGTSTKQVENKARPEAMGAAAVQQQPLPPTADATVWPLPLPELPVTGLAAAAAAVAGTAVHLGQVLSVDQMT